MYMYIQGVSSPVARVQCPRARCIYLLSVEMSFVAFLCLSTCFAVLVPVFICFSIISPFLFPFLFLFISFYLPSCVIAQTLPATSTQTLSPSPSPHPFHIFTTFFCTGFYYCRCQFGCVCGVALIHMFSPLQAIRPDMIKTSSGNNSSSNNNNSTSNVGGVGGGAGGAGTGGLVAGESTLAAQGAGTVVGSGWVRHGMELYGLDTLWEIVLNATGTEQENKKNENKRHTYKYEVYLYVYTRGT